MGFRENLKSELFYQDIQAKELAAKIGMSRHTLGNYLNSRERIPSADVALKIARALGVSVEYLVTGEDSTKGKTSLDRETQALVKAFKQLSPQDRDLVNGIIKLLQSRENVKRRV